MSLAVNHNLMSANTARNLNAHCGRLATSTQRLSSGLRINGAADDAAGLAIRELMRADVAALNQGVRNANDAISLLQTADAALGIIDEKLIRMKELAEQAATGTYNSTQRLMIDSEFQAMASEINRIANATDFNGIKLLDGSLAGVHNGNDLNSSGRMKIHFGPANDSSEDYYYIDIGKCTTGALGLGDAKMVMSGSDYDLCWWLDLANIDFENKKIKLDIPDMRAGLWHRDKKTFCSGVDNLYLPNGLSNITISSYSTEMDTSLPLNFRNPHVCIFTRDAEQLIGPAMDRSTIDQIGSNIEVKDAWGSAFDISIIIDEAIDMRGLFNAGSSYNSAQTTMRQGQYTFHNGNLSIEMITGQTHYLPNPDAFPRPEEIIKINNTSEDLVLTVGGRLVYGGTHYSLSLTADIDDAFLAGIKSSLVYDPDSTIHIDTQDKAQHALVAVDNAIVSKDKIRAHLGAMQNRLENTVSNLNIQAENLQAAESRISDVDVATEMTNFVRNQILTQSAVAMLSQANTLPQMAMQLIGG